MPPCSSTSDSQPLADYTAIGTARDTPDTVPTFLTVHATVPNRIVAPAAVVFSRPVATYHDSMIGRRCSQFNFELVCAAIHDRRVCPGRPRRPISGTSSVPAAIEADPTSAAQPLPARVRQAADYGVAFADTEFIGARFLVEVTR